MIHDVKSEEEYRPPAAAAGPQQALLSDVLRVVLHQLDICLEEAAKDVTPFLAFDGRALFGWFRALIVLYQNSFRSICRRLRQHPLEHVPFSILLWQTYMRDVLTLTVMSAHGVAKQGNHTSDLSIALGLHTAAQLCHGMLNLKLGCLIGGDGPFSGLMALDLENPLVKRAVQHCPVLPFDATLRSLRSSITEWEKSRGVAHSEAVASEIAQVQNDFAASFGARLWEKGMPESSILDVPSHELYSAEALMGANHRRPQRQWTLLCNLLAPHIVSSYVVLLPTRVIEWCRQETAAMLAGRRRTEELTEVIAARAEHLVDAEQQEPVVELEDEEAEEADQPPQQQEKRCTVQDTARLLLEQTGRDYEEYAVGRWTSKTGVSGNPPGRQPMMVAQAVDELWNAEESAPYMCIFTKQFWVDAEKKTPGCRPKFTFSKPRVLKGAGAPLLHFTMKILEMVESALWRGTTANHMLRNALSQDQATLQFERIALATAMKAVLNSRFPMDQVFALHCMSDGKFTGAAKMWKF
jgi:hypothetical protein